MLNNRPKPVEPGTVVETYEKNGQLYEVRQIDSKNTKSFLVGAATPSAPTPLPSVPEVPDLTIEPEDDLTVIKGIGAAKAKAIKETGILTIVALANSDHPSAELAQEHLAG